LTGGREKKKQYYEKRRVKGIDGGKKNPERGKEGVTCGGSTEEKRVEDLVWEGTV